MKAKIIIVEDEAIIAKDIEYYLMNLGYFVVGVAHDSLTALDMIHTREPDLVLLDINIEGDKDGIDIAKVINEKYKIPFLFLTSFSDEYTLGRAKETKPSGYIVKPFDEIDLKTSIAIALHNFTSSNEGKVMTIDKINNISLTPFSDQEYNIFHNLMDGMSSNEIAEKQFVSVNTVKYHLKKIYNKMDVAGKNELMSKVLKIQ